MPNRRENMMATKKDAPKATRVPLLTKQGIHVTVGSDVVDTYLKRGYTRDDESAEETPAPKK
jgi:hypothetical protein